MLLNIWTVTRRELGALFVQPIAYVFAGMLTFLTGLLFAAHISFPAAQGGPPPTLAPIMSTFTFLSVFGIPALTMRLLAEEQEKGTLELVMTLPLTDVQLILGKFLATFIFYVTVVALTLVYPLILVTFGNPDGGPIISTYVGTLLWGAALIAVGLLASAMSDNQIVAYMLGIGIILFLYLTLIPAQLFSVGPVLSSVLAEMSLQNHLYSFLEGLITVKDVLYYLMIAAIALFAATRVLESRRWR